MPDHLSTSFRTILLLLSIAFTGLWPQLYAQFPTVFRFGTTEGLPSNEVYDVEQDKDGLLWIASDRGISRYDGKEFRNYTVADGLPSPAIILTHSDSLGRIFFCVRGGKVGMITEDSIFVYPGKLERKVYHQPVYFQSDGGSPIPGIRISDGLRGWELDGNGPVRPIDPFPVRIELNHSGPCFLHTKYGSFHIRELEEFLLYQRTLYHETRTGFLWASSGYLFVYDSAADSLYKVNHHFQTISGIFGDSHGRYWLATAKGFFMSPDARFRNFIQYYPEEFGTSIQEDFEGGIWLSTIHNGLLFLPDVNIQEYFKGQAVSSLLVENEERLWLCANTKLWNCQEGRFEAQEIVEGEVERIRDLCLGPEGAIYMAYEPGGIINLQTREKIGYSFSPRSLHVSKAGLIYRAGGGLYLNAPENEMVADYNEYVKIADPWCMWETAEGIILVGTGQGLYQYDPQKRESGMYPLDHPILRNEIRDITGTHDGKLALATLDQGLVLINEGQVISLRQEDGLCSNVCQHVLFSPDERSLLVSTNKGLSVITDPFGKKPLIHNLRRRNGLSADNVFQTAIWHDSLWVGTSEGLNVMPWPLPEGGRVPPRMRVTEFLVNKVLIPTGQESSPLSYDQNNLLIRFEAVSFKKPGELAFRYRLKGLMDSWEETRDEYLVFPNLQPGEYDLQLLVRDPDGLQSPIQSLKISIQPPFWTLTSFRITAVLLFLGIILLLTYLRIRAVRKRAALHNSLNDQRQKALGLQMNPHFVFNSLNSIQKFILEHDTRQSSIYLSRFSSLMRQIIDNSRETLIPLSRELEALELYLSLEKRRFKEKMDYSIDCAENLGAAWVPPLLLQPLVENAVWHGILHKNEPGQVTIQIREEGERLRISVEDNGVGRKLAREYRAQSKLRHEPVGLEVTERRLEVLSQIYKVRAELRFDDLTDDDGRPLGTRAVMWIPLITQHDANHTD